MLKEFNGHWPQLAQGVFVADGACVIGQVTVGAEASIWYNTLLRGDMDRIEVGSGTNIQDLTVVHVDRGIPAVIGERVTVGHRCVVHGCSIEDECLIGMGSILLNRVHVGTHSIVAAGSVLRENFVVPSGTLVAGVPAQIKRELTKEEVAGLPRIAREYAALARMYLGKPQPRAGRNETAGCV